MTSQDQQDKTVIIVDDSPEVRQRLREAYLQLGYKVLGEAENGVEAINFIANGEQPDVLSLDIIMPEMDGVECYQRVHKQYPEIECVFISVLAQDIRVIQAFDGEIEHHRFIAKPVRVDRIQQALEKIFVSEQSEEIQDEDESDNESDSESENEESSENQPELPPSDESPEELEKSTAS